MCEVELWTDGSGTTAERPGGWAFVLVAREDDRVVKRHEGQGYVLTGGTNNRMELTAVLEGLRALRPGARVMVRSDSEYVCRAFTDGWIAKWVRKDWRKVKNADLWRRIVAEAERRDVTFRWVPGHAGVALNEDCDRRAGAMRALAIAEAAPSEE